MLDGNYLVSFQCTDVYILINFCTTKARTLANVRGVNFDQRCLVSSPNSDETTPVQMLTHDDVIKWKHFPRYWPFVWGIHRSTVNSPHRGQWRRALMFSLIFDCINSWVKNHEAGDLRRHRGHYDVFVMWYEDWYISMDLYYNSLNYPMQNESTPVLYRNMHTAL